MELLANAEALPHELRQVCQYFGHLAAKAQCQSISGPDVGNGGPKAAQPGSLLQGRRLQKQEDAIVEAAIEEVERIGISEASLDVVARQVDFSTGTIVSAHPQP